MVEIGDEICTEKRRRNILIYDTEDMTAYDAQTVMEIFDMI